LVPAASAQTPPVVDNRPAATVNNDTITMGELDAVIKREHPSAVTMSDQERKNLQLGVVGELIDDRLLQQFLRASGPPVGAADVTSWIRKTEADLKAQGQTLPEFCKERGWDDAQLKQNVADMLRWTGYANARLS